MQRYSTDVDPDKAAKAYGYELHCSLKDSINLAHAIRGMKTEDARKYLEEIISMKRPLPAVFHNRKRAHQKGIGPGSFPQKAARYMLKTVINAENNAEYKGFDSENMKIVHIYPAAHIKPDLYIQIRIALIPPGNVIRTRIEVSPDNLISPAGGFFSTVIENRINRPFFNRVDDRFDPQVGCNKISLSKNRTRNHKGKEHNH